MAYRKGQEVLMESKPQDELGVIVEKTTAGDLVFAGTAWSTAIIHRYGLLHTTVLLVSVAAGDGSEPVFVIHRRSPRKRTSPNALDFNGGHLTFSVDYIGGSPFDSAYDLPTAVYDTALREAREEIHLTPPYVLRQDDIYPFQKIGFFDCDTETPTGRNREASSCFLVRLPPGHEYHMSDTDPDGVDRVLKHECFRCRASERVQ